MPQADVGALNANSPSQKSARWIEANSARRAGCWTTGNRRSDDGRGTVELLLRRFAVCAAVKHSSAAEAALAEAAARATADRLYLAVPRVPVSVADPAATRTRSRTHQ